MSLCSWRVFPQASRDGQVEDVQTFLESGLFELSELDDRGFSPLHLAARYDHVEVVQTLLNHGAG